MWDIEKIEADILNNSRDIQAEVEKANDETLKSLILERHKLFEVYYLAKGKDDLLEALQEAKKEYLNRKGTDEKEALIRLLEKQMECANWVVSEC